MTTVATIITAGVEARLQDSGKWESDDVGVAQYLNDRFGPDLYPPSPAYPVDVGGQVVAAAELLGATITWVLTGGDDADQSSRVY